MTCRIAAMLLYLNNIPMLAANTEPDIAFSGLSTSVSAQDSVKIGEDIKVSYRLYYKELSDSIDSDNFSLITEEPSCHSGLTERELSWTLSRKIFTGEHRATEIYWTLTLKADQTGVFSTPDYSLFYNGQQIEISPKKKRIVVYDDTYEQSPQEI